MLTLVDEVADYLEFQGIGAVGTDIFVGREHPDVTDSIIIRATGGSSDPIYATLRTPTFQILTKGEAYNTTYEKTESIYNALNNKWNILATLNCRIISAVLPGAYYRDDNDLVTFPLNFTAYLVKKEL